MKKSNQNLFKVALLALTFCGISTMNAQSGDAAVNTTQADAAGETIKLIDNKGTIKYLQANNGITTITSTAANNLTTTTWQLGGTLLEDTDIATGANEFKITLDTGGTFILDGIVQETGSAADAIPGTGWTLLSRDEATGEVRKLLPSDLVSGIRTEHTQGADASADVAITVTGLPTLTAATTAAKLFVYRNGAKLRFGTDFAVAADTVTITYSATDLPMYSGDVIEIQYIK